MFSKDLTLLESLPDAHGQACCTVPPAEDGYGGKGTYIEVDNMKTCEENANVMNHCMADICTDKTGPADATTAILIIPDIFGFSGQVLQVKCPSKSLESSLRVCW